MRDWKDIVLVFFTLTTGLCIVASTAANIVRCCQADACCKPDNCCSSECCKALEARIEKLERAKVGSAPEATE